MRENDNIFMVLHSLHMTFINELTDLFQVLFWSSIISLDLLQGAYFFENFDKEILMDGCFKSRVEIHH